MSVLNHSLTSLKHSDRPVGFIQRHYRYGCFQNRLQTERNALLVERRALVGREAGLQHATSVCHVAFCFMQRTGPRPGSRDYQSDTEASN